MTVTRRPTEQAAPDGSTLIWDRVDFGGCVYMLAFNSGDVKIGKTRHLRARFNTHVSEMRRFYGARLCDFYFTRTHVGYSTTEDLALRAAESVMTADSLRSGEWFSGLDLERLEEALKEIDPTKSYTETPARCAA